MVESYVEQAKGVDSKYRDQLLNRKSPIELVLQYHLICIRHSIRNLFIGCKKEKQNAESFVEDAQLQYV